MFDALKQSWIWPGIAEVGEFLGTHLISGMIPAFFIAGAIAVFLDKERVTRLMGRNASPWVAYPVAALSGGVLTVCSCGVLPIFSGIRTQGAGTGPAFTFLFASPAINLIALTYTFTYMGPRVALARAVAVMVCAVFVGMAMRAIFGDEVAPETAKPLMMIEDEERSARQQVAFFGMLVLVMATSTGFLDSLLNWIPLQQALTGVVVPDRAGPLARVVWKLGLIAFEVGIILIMLKRWFHRAEIETWLKKSWNLFERIFPKVLLGIFISGILAALFPLVRFMSLFDANTLQSNLMVAFIGGMMYFGTIVGVNIVATMHRYGMHLGPALTLLLAGPAVSLPEVLALIPLVGKKKAVTYLALVICSAATCGWLFGMMN